MKAKKEKLLKKYFLVKILKIKKWTKNERPRVLLFKVFSIWIQILSDHLELVMAGGQSFATLFSLLKVYDRFRTSTWLMKSQEAAHHHAGEDLQELY